MRREGRSSSGRLADGEKLIRSLSLSVIRHSTQWHQPCRPPVRLIQWSAHIIMWSLAPWRSLCLVCTSRKSFSAFCLSTVCSLMLCILSSLGFSGLFWSLCHATPSQTHTHTHTLSLHPASSLSQVQAEGQLVAGVEPVLAGGELGRAGPGEEAGRPPTAALLLLPSPPAASLRRPALPPASTRGQHPGPRHLFYPPALATGARG